MSAQHECKTVPAKQSGQETAEHGGVIDDRSLPVGDASNEPTAYRVISEPRQTWHFARTREDAEKIAENLLKYASRCTGTRIQSLGILSEDAYPQLNTGRTR